MAKEKAPPYRFVGVVEIEGMETEKLSVFYERVAKAGAGAGCEAMLQRDAFPVMSHTPVAVTQSLQRVGGDRGSVREPGAGGSFVTGGGSGLRRGKLAIWQFICGVGGATQEQAEVTLKKAVAPTGLSASEQAMVASPAMEESMKLSLAALCLAAACAPMEHRFVKIDHDFAANSRAEPPEVFVDEAEMLKKQAPPYRYVGVVEVEGKETEKLTTFYERVAKAGADSGCEAMLQRDAFQGVIVAQRHDMMGRDMKRNNMAIWQFLCGVTGATEAEATASLKQAVAMAVRMRSDEMGNQEVCTAYTPTGSRVRKNRVCADDPHGRTRPDGANSDR